jgi:hypothetical protein
MPVLENIRSMSNTIRSDVINMGSIEADRKMFEGLFEKFETFKSFLKMLLYLTKVLKF